MGGRSVGKPEIYDEALPPANHFQPTTEQVQAVYQRAHQYDPTLADELTEAIFGDHWQGISPV